MFSIASRADLLSYGLLPKSGKPGAPLVHGHAIPFVLPLPRIEASKHVVDAAEL